MPYPTGSSPVRLRPTSELPGAFRHPASRRMTDVHRPSRTDLGRPWGCREAAEPWTPTGPGGALRGKAQVTRSTVRKCANLKVLSGTRGSASCASDGASQPRPSGRVRETLHVARGLPTPTATGSCLFRERHAGAVVDLLRGARPPGHSNGGSDLGRPARASVSADTIRDVAQLAVVPDQARDPRSPVRRRPRGARRSMRSFGGWVRVILCSRAGARERMPRVGNHSLRGSALSGKPRSRAIRRNGKGGGANQYAPTAARQRL